MTPAAPENNRLHQLLADRAVQGLSAPEAAELDQLLRETPGAAALAEQYELAAAAADLALLGGASAEAMPASLREKIEADADHWLDARRGGSLRPEIAGRIRPTSVPRAGLGGVAGWLAAAACLALAASVWFGRPAATSPADPAAERAALLSSATDVIQVAWSAAGELEKTAVQGDVVWSTREQKGFMTLSGLPANDPSREQYQLWIFDPAQSDKTPIDGGVFDAAAGAVVVPIDPKIRVTGATLFAVTIEKPGGVVVSDRSRLVLIAKPG